MKTRWAFVHKHDILTHKNNMLFLEVKRPPLLWWHMAGNPLKLPSIYSSMIETSLDLSQKYLVIFRKLRQSSGIFRKCLERLPGFWTTVRESSEIFWKSSKKASPSQLDISLVCCAHSWYIKLNTWIEIPYLHGTMYYTPCTPLEVNQNSISVMIWICLMGHNLKT